MAVFGSGYGVLPFISATGSGAVTLITENPPTDCVTTISVSAEKDGFDSLSLPTSFFQARLKKSPKQSSINVVIPNALTIADSLENYQDGELAVSIFFDNDEIELIRANISRIDFYAGSRSYSMQINGTKQTTWTENKTWSPVSVIYQSSIDGTNRFRLGGLFVKPDDNVVIDGSVINVDEVTIAVNLRNILCEVLGEYL